MPLTYHRCFHFLPTRAFFTRIRRDVRSCVTTLFDFESKVNDSKWTTLRHHHDRFFIVLYGILSMCYSIVSFNRTLLPTVEFKLGSRNFKFINIRNSSETLKSFFKMLKLLKISNFEKLCIFEFCKRWILEISNNF